LLRPKTGKKAAKDFSPRKKKLNQSKRGKKNDPRPPGKKEREKKGEKRGKKGNLQRDHLKFLTQLQGKKHPSPTEKKKESNRGGLKRKKASVGEGAENDP